MCSYGEKEAKIQTPEERSSYRGIWSCLQLHSDSWEKTAMTTFEEQTEHVVNALYYDLLHDDEIDNRCLQTDSGGKT